MVMRWRRVHDYYRPPAQVVPVEFIPVRLMVGKPSRPPEKLSAATTDGAAEENRRSLSSVVAWYQ